MPDLREGSDVNSGLLRDGRLSPRHRAVLFYMSKGLRNSEIARQLGISERAVKYCISQLMLILDATNRTELVGLFADLTKVS
jgi:DNA-binding NarL/FixJ family response regulator